MQYLLILIVFLSVAILIFIATINSKKEHFKTACDIHSAIIPSEIDPLINMSNQFSRTYLKDLSNEDFKALFSVTSEDTYIDSLSNKIDVKALDIKKNVLAKLVSGMFNAFPSIAENGYIYRYGVTTNLKTDYNILYGEAVIIMQVPAAAYGKVINIQFILSVDGDKVEIKNIHLLGNIPAINIENIVNLHH